MYNCNKCAKPFNLKQAKTNHEKYCNGYGTKKDKIKKLNICPKCNLIIKNMFIVHINKCDGYGPRGRRLKNAPKGPGSGWTNGKTWIEIYGKERALEIKNKLSKSTKGHNHGNPLTLEKKEKKRKKLRKIALKRYENGWDPKCGRAPKIDYISSIAGEVKLDGSWELKVAQYLDSKEIKWERNKKRFPYINLKNKNSTYKPDFYIYDWDSYLEIKGYETELDECKWSQFKDNLIIWRKKDLKERKIL